MRRRYGAAVAVAPPSFALGLGARLRAVRKDDIARFSGVDRRVFRHRIVDGFPVVNPWLSSGMFEGIIMPHLPTCYAVIASKTQTNFRAEVYNN